MTFEGPDLAFDRQELCQPLAHSSFEQLGIDVDVLRLDNIDPVLSGNKWFKLRLNIEQAVEAGRLPLISFGGAFSNHIHALAAAGERFGFDTVGVIRGEPEYAQNPTLSDAVKSGMTLHFVDRQTYQKKTEPQFHQTLFERYGNATVIPEGGANLLGVTGCKEIADLIALDTQRKHHIVMATATGATFAGVLAGLHQQSQRDSRKTFTLHGIAVLKAGSSIVQNVRFWLDQLSETSASNTPIDESNWFIHGGFHLGGYARITAPLVALMDRAQAEFSLPLDPIYTGKMLLGFYQLLEQGEIQAGDKVTLIHTGGLQGIRGCQARLEALRQGVNA